MSCRFIQDNNGEITGALTQTGERSKLFDQLNEQFGKNKAVELFAVSESDEFQEIFGGVKKQNKDTLSKKDSKSLKKLLDFKTDSVTIYDDNATSEILIEQLSDGEVSLHISEIWSDIKGQGSGTKLLNKLKYFSNEFYVPLSLRASTNNNIRTSDGINQENLVKWYEKNGFYISEEDNNFEADETAPFMVYQPTINRSQEPTVENLLRYIAEENKTTEKLTKEQLVDLQDFSNFDRQKLFDTFYDNNGLFIVNESKLTKSGLYSPYEAGMIAMDMQLQQTIKDSLERLKNTSEEELNLIETNSNREMISEFNSFGKLVTIEGVNQNNEGVKQAEVFVDVNGEIRPKRNTETELILPITAKRTENKKVNDLNNLSLSTLQENPIETRQVLDEIENELIKDSIDVIGLTEKPIDENLKDFITVLDRFIKAPTEENSKTFAEKSDEYFSRDLSPRTQFLKKENIEGEANKEYVKLETTLTEEEIYNQQGLIKLDDNTYIKTAKEDLTTLYENLRTYTEKYPKDKTLEEHVQEQLKNYNYTNAETAEAIILYKMYFGVDNGLIKDKKGNLLAPNGKVSNLNEEQWKLVRTPEFISWFGAWQNDPQNASKVVDENGEPLVVWHGTPYNIQEDGNAKFYPKTKPFTEFKSDINQKKIYFTTNKKVAESYTMTYGHTIPVFLNIRNIGEYNANKKGFNTLSENDPTFLSFVEDFEDVNGVVVKDIYDAPTGKYEKGDLLSNVYAVNNSNQIKSATEIKGVINEDTNDIRYLKAVTPTKQVSNFTGNYNYLTEEFPSDFYSKFLAEKKKASKLFRNFYSNFEINEKGINLINKSETALRNIRIYADENLKQYSLISRQMPDLIEAEQSITNPRVEAINNPQKIKESKENLYKLNDQEVIIKNEIEDFVKIGNDIYESVAKQGNLNHYVKLENTNSNYYAVEVKAPQTKLKLSDYSYLNENPEKFKTIKDFLKGENPDELSC